MCDEPKIDNSTQEPMNCTNHTAYGKDFQFLTYIDSNYIFQGSI